MAGVLVLTACAVFDAFAPSGAVGDVSWLVTADTCMAVGDTSAFGATLLVQGVALSQQRLRITNSDTTVVTLTPAGDALVALQQGMSVLTVQLIHSTLGADAPDTAFVVHVRPGAVCGAP